MTPLLRAKDLVKDFGPVRAVDHVSFTVDQGETLGLVGESGCGKSTTGRCLLRLIEPASGEVRFGGEDVLSLPRRRLRRLRQSMQIVFQDPFSSLNPRIRVGAAVGEPLYVHRRGSKTDIYERVLELLERVGLRRGDYDCFPHELSGGQRQRVGIARALALNPKLIVADEPVSALDVSVQAQIINLMRDLQQELSVAYLFISHDLSVVRHVAHRTAVMYLGRIVEMAPTARLFDDARHPYTKALLSAVPIADPTRERSRIALRGGAPDSHRIPLGCRFHPRCPYAMDVCRHLDPETTDCGAEHEAACHLLEEHG